MMGAIISIVAASSGDARQNHQRRSPFISGAA
jgi:hypothetical protein